MPRARGEHLFTFAVISDSHVNEAEDRSASPFASNRLANARFRYVIRRLNQQKPAFTVHLGDMGNPLPELATYRDAAANFEAIAGELESPLHLVPGNHCVGDKPSGWVPVPRVCETSLAQYERTYGRYNYSFDHGPCHFAILNSLVINSNLARERAQREWLETDLERAAAKGQRLFVMMHYPAYVGARDELASYDNLDEPGRTWLLHLFEENGVEAAYSGHVHNYFYNRAATTQLYTLPATSFVRQDYSELFRVGPADGEGGRNDTVKLGYFLVRVHERGHTNRLVRTLGRVLQANQGLDPLEGLETPPSRENRLASIGTEMRENWLSRTALQLNNSVSPFTRRCARNDWAVLALEEMGVSRVRLALQELVKPDVPQRMAPLKDAGFRFTVYSHGIPGDTEYDSIRQHSSVLAGWELMLTAGQIQSVAARAKRGAGGPTEEALPPWFLNEVREVRTAEVEDANVKHVANYGFQLAERDRVEALARSEEIQNTFAGFVFRLRRRGEADLELWPQIREISGMGRETGLRHQVHILFSGNVTAERFEDDLASANRVAEATLAAVAAGNVDVHFDTFEDIDRGYFVRHGLVDRRYNPRLAAHVLRNLRAALSTFLSVPDVERVAATEADPSMESFSATDIPGGRQVSGVLEDAFLGLILPKPTCTVGEIDGVETRIDGCLTVVDLGKGGVSRVPATVTNSRLRLEEPLTAESPQLLVGGV